MVAIPIIEVRGEEGFLDDMLPERPAIICHSPLALDCCPVHRTIVSNPIYLYSIDTTGLIERCKEGTPD